MLDLDVGHLDAPGVGLRVEHALDVDVQLLALGEQLVELVLAEHRAQRGLRELAGRLEEVLDLDDRVLRVDDAEVDHRVHLHRDVVARDHVLRRHVEHDGAQVDAHHLLDARDDDDRAPAPSRAGSARAGTPPPRSYSRRMRLIEMTSTSASSRSTARDSRSRQATWLSSSRRLANTSSTRPSMPVTRTRSPAPHRLAARARATSRRAPAPSPRRRNPAITSPVAPIISSRPVTTGALGGCAPPCRPTRIRKAALAAASPAMSA